jgi:hypothetical protein
MHMLLIACTVSFIAVPKHHIFHEMCRHTAGLLCDKDAVLGATIGEILIRDSGEITNKMQPCNRIYYSTVYWRLNMFRAAHRSSSGALTVFAASGLHTHVVTGRSQVWVGRSPHAYVNQGLQIQSSWWWAVCRSKHVEPSINGGIINSITRLHLVGYFYWFILRCTDPWILNLYVRKTNKMHAFLNHLFHLNYRIIV